MKTFKDMINEAPEEEEIDETYGMGSHISVSQQLLTMLFTFFRDGDTEEEDVHDIVELMAHLGVNGEILTTSVYDYVVGNDDMDDEDYSDDFDGEDGD